jgi:hypothetical protein
MVPDSSPRAQRECWYSLGGFCRVFGEGTGLSRFLPCSIGCARAHLTGVAPKASKESFDSSEV